MGMKILIVDDDEQILETLGRALRREGWTVDTAEDAAIALRKLDDVDLVVSDIWMPGMDGLQLLSEVRKQHPNIEVIIMSAQGTILSAVEAIREGARAYLIKPFDIQELLLHVRQVNELLQFREASAAAGRGELIGSTETMCRAYAQIDVAAASDAPVLITGQTGTGKDLAAHAIHDESAQKEGPFVPVNLGAMPRELAEGELFGHKKGAFTSASTAMKGRFQLASGGTLFLDEIDSLPLELQPKLLRAIEEKEVWPLGAEKPDNAAVRIMAATNADIESLVSQGVFREDLYYRLNVIRIHMPALKEHVEDIPLIIGKLLDRLGSKKSGQTVTVLPEALAYLVVQPWPGNVRELSNKLEQAIAQASVLEKSQSGGKIEIGVDYFTKLAPVDLDMPFKDAKAQVADEWAERVIRAAFVKCDGNVSETARTLQMNRTALIRLLKKYGISSSEERSS